MGDTDRPVDVCMFSPTLKGGGIPFARAYLPYILNLRTLVTISLETAANRGVFFQPKIEFSSYVCEAF